MNKEIKQDKVISGYTHYIASISYGKDSLAMLEIIHQKGYPLTQIITVDVMATPTMSAYFDEIEEFKQKADSIIKERYGLPVIHLRANTSFEEEFYKVKGKRAKPENQGKIYGFPLGQGRSWCNGTLKMKAIRRYKKANQLWYVGYAIDEKSKRRQTKIQATYDKRIYPLVEEGISEGECMEICKSLNLLSPAYSTAQRDGCWFCMNQSLDQLRNLRANHPYKWKKLLEWDKDSPYPFRRDYTVAQLEEKFKMEEK